MRVEQKLKMLQEERKGRRKGGVCCPMHGGCHDGILRSNFRVLFGKMVGTIWLGSLGGVGC